MFIHPKQKRNVLKTFILFLFLGFLAIDAGFAQNNAGKVGHVSQASGIMRKAPYLIFNGNSDETVVPW